MCVLRRGDSLYLYFPPVLWLQVNLICLVIKFNVSLKSFKNILSHLIVSSWSKNLLTSKQNCTDDQKV